MVPIEEETCFAVDPQTAAQVSKMRAESLGWRDLHLRVYLCGKGCDGFEYGVTFDQKEPDDIEFSIQAEEPFSVICDPPAFEFVKGSSITWIDDDRGKGFLIENPRHKKFRGKFYKRKFWQEKLLGKAPETSEVQ